MKVSHSLVVIGFVLAILVMPTSISALVANQASSGYLDLTPSSGPIGIDVKISGLITKGPNQDQSCSISSPTNPSIINNANPSLGVACTINGGASTSGNFTGSFAVGNVPPGQYVIEVTACPGNNGCAPSQGDWVQAIFVTQGSPTIAIGPNDGSPGNTLQVIGSGFSLNDNSCALSGYAVGSVIDCKISGGTLTGTFVVANVPTGFYEVAATGNTGDSANANVGVSQSGQNTTGIPGFPAQAIILGMLLGALIILVRRKRQASSLK